MYVMKHLAERVEVLNRELKKWAVVKEEPIFDILYKQCDYKKDNNLPQKEELTLFQGVWGGKRDDHYWFRFELQAENLPDCDVEIDVKTELMNWDITNPQFIAYVDGEIVQGLDINHCAFSITPGKHIVYLYAYTGTNVDSTLQLFAHIRYTNKKAKKLYYDLLVPMESLSVMGKNTKEYADTLLMLNEAYKKLDFLTPGTAEFYDACEDVSAWFEKKYYKGYCGKERVVLAGVGQSHIDIAWLWAIRQTREKIQRSFATVLALMERYPEYCYMQSQPYLYEMLKEEAPALYEKLKQRVKEGRWETEGGMFVEADTNMSSGESLIRQIALGKKFYKEEFNTDTTILWLPDSFGFPASIPQIMKKTGLNALVTSKLSWNDMEKMPYDLFDWQGIDGSSVFTYFLTAKPIDSEDRYTACNADVNAPFLAGTYDRLQQKDCTNEAIFAYGFGDGGGGPSEEQLEKLRRYNRGVPAIPTVTIDTLKNSLQRVERKARKSGRLPQWKGELALQFHRGTYTSVSNNKKNNRKAEVLLHNIELYASIAKQLLGVDYAEKWLEKAWRVVLINQFHDILPGTCVEQAHRESDKEYQEFFAEGNQVLDKYLTVLSENFGNGYTIFNPNAFEASGYILEDGEYKYVKAVPANGFISRMPEKVKNGVSVKQNGLENKYYRLRFGKNGEIVSIYDKQAQREVLKAPAKLVAYEDRSLWFESAEIRRFYKEKEYFPTLLAMEDVRYGEKAGKKLTFRLGSSIITQDVCLYTNSRRIDFDVTLDWKEEKTLLRTLFPIDVNTQMVKSDIQFAHDEKPTSENTDWERARFEFCAHKYVDVSEGNYGVALMNDCKYGYSATDNVLGLSLLRCHELSSNYIDKAKHQMTYVLYPHIGDLGHSDVLQQAYLLNNPFTFIKTEASKSGKGYSFVSSDADNVVVETIKQSEDGVGYIVRLYESANCKTKCTLTLGKYIEKAYICDMLETPEKQVLIDGNEIHLTLKPFEIVTIKLQD